jgi:hypothetical protein
MSFDRRLLPDPQSYYQSKGLTLSGRGSWRSTACTFHGSRSTMRVNVVSGAFVCMASCPAKGGDCLAYEMATEGVDFVQAAKNLGCWTGGDSPARHIRPNQLRPIEALQLLDRESLLVGICAANMAEGAQLSQATRKRLSQAVAAIGRIRDVAAP